jgi:hypothetical protein
MACLVRLLLAAGLVAAAVEIHGKEAPQVTSNKVLTFKHPNGQWATVQSAPPYNFRLKAEVTAEGISYDDNCSTDFFCSFLGPNVEPPCLVNTFDWRLNAHNKVLPLNEEIPAGATFAKLRVEDHPPGSLGTATKSNELAIRILYDHSEPLTARWATEADLAELKSLGQAETREPRGEPRESSSGKESGEEPEAPKTFWSSIKCHWGKLLGAVVAVAVVVVVVVVLAARTGASEPETDDEESEPAALADKEALKA